MEGISSPHEPLTQAQEAPTTSSKNYHSMPHSAYFIYAAQTAAAMFAATFKEFPPVQHPNTFTIDDAMAKMNDAASGANH